MTDALESGACQGCGNRLYEQVTLVLLKPDTNTQEMADGRQRKFSERVTKAYRCLNCRSVYIWNEADDGFRRAEG